MFMTLPELEQRGPRPRLPAGAQSWAAIYIEVELPWFLVRFLSRRVRLTVAVTNENELIDLLRGQSATSVAAIQCMALSEFPNGIWTMNEALAMWLPESDEWTDTGPLIIEFRDKAGKYCSTLESVAQPDRSRTLLWSLEKKRAA